MVATMLMLADAHFQTTMFVFQHFTKLHLEILLNFGFSHTFGREKVKRG